MKKIIYNISIISLLALLLFGATSCQDWLDLRPEGEVVLEDYWKSESQAEAVLMSCYRSLTERAVVERMLLWGELRSDNVISGFSLDYDVYKVLNVDITPTNRLCRWGAFYRTINFCNTFLYYAPGVVDKDINYSTSELNAMRSEALTIRSLAYFYLVRTFKNVPYVTTPSIDDTQDYSIAQTEGDDLLDSLVVDLKFALKYAPETYQFEDQIKGRITKNAVRALLADIYLWQEEYNKCIDVCQQVINDPTLELEKSEEMFTNVFANGNSKESIFELQFDDDEIENTAVKDAYGTSGRIEGYLMYPQYLLLSDDKNVRDNSPFGYSVSSKLRESEEDIRLSSFVRNNQDADDAGYYLIFKYAGQRVDLTEENPRYNYLSSSPNWIVYRLPDVLLMQAEALAQRNGGGDLEAAVDLVNMTYLRSNPELGNDSLKIENYTSQSDVEKLVLRERQRELMFEGKRWFDLLRLARRENSTKAVLNYVTIKYGASGGLQDNKLTIMDALYLPVHRDEMTVNGELVQNPFYEQTSGSSNKE